MPKPHQAGHRRYPMIRRAFAPWGAMPSSMVTIGCAMAFGLVAVAIGLTRDPVPPVYAHWTLRGSLPVEAPARQHPPLATPLHGGAKPV